MNQQSLVQSSGAPLLPPLHLRALHSKEVQRLLRREPVFDPASEKHKKSKSTVSYMKLVDNYQHALKKKMRAVQKEVREAKRKVGATPSIHHPAAKEQKGEEQRRRPKDVMQSMDLLANDREAKK